MDENFRDGGESKSDHPCFK